MGKSQGAFKTALQAARVQLQVFHSDVKDIRSFFKTVIRPDLQALREQKQMKEGTRFSQMKNLLITAVIVVLVIVGWMFYKNSKIPSYVPTVPKPAGYTKLVQAQLMKLIRKLIV